MAFNKKQAEEGKKAQRERTERKQRPGRQSEKPSPARGPLGPTLLGYAPAQSSCRWHARGTPR